MKAGLPMGLLAALMLVQPRPDQNAQSALFVESAATSGLTFTHVNGAAGRYYMPEVMGAGVALFDYDNDGDLDVFLVQGGSLDPETTLKGRPTSRLFRNDLKINARASPASLHRRHGTFRPRAPGVWHGDRGRRLRQRRRPGSARHIVRRRDAVSQQRRRHVRRRHEGRRRDAIRSGARAPRSSTTIATATSISSSPTTWISPSRGTKRVATASAPWTTARPVRTNLFRIGSTAMRGTERSPTSRKRPGSRRPTARGSG